LVDKRRNRPVCPATQSAHFRTLRIVASLSRRPNRILTGLRLSLGMTQEEYAQAAQVSTREVRAWEAGEVSCPQAFALQRLHALHGTTGPEDLGFAPRGARRPVGTVGESDQMEVAVYRRNLVGLALAAAFSTQHLPAIAGLLQSSQEGRRVGLGDLQRVTRTNTGLASTDLTVGGAAVSSEVLLRQFRTAAALLHGQFSRDSIRTAMHSAVAHLGSTIGFMLFDQGRPLPARQVYLASIRIAGGADDLWPLRAIICSEMARQARHYGLLSEADELIGIAHGADSHLTDTAKAMLHALSASAAAAAGDRTRTDEHIRRAEDAFGHADPKKDPEWIAWFTRAELAGDTGEAMAVLASHHEELRDEAAARLTASATTHQPTAQRSAALAFIRLAELHTARRSPALVGAAAHQAVDLAERLRSPRLTQTLTSTTAAMASLKAHPDVASAIARIQALAPTASTYAG
jgi:transcriptional regulator with XRE-family HTH domain